MGQPTHRVRAIPVALVAAAALLWPGAAPAMNIYDFESLSLGDLDGQDGWVQSYVGKEAKIVLGAGVNPTLYATGEETTADPEGIFHRRVNDASWSFVPFTGRETAAFLQADFIVNESSSPTLLTQSLFYVYQPGGSRSPAFGVTDNRGWVAGEPVWHLRTRLWEADELWYSAPIGSAASVGDWVRMRIVMDFTDTSGGRDGSVSAFYMNLSAAETTFTAISGLQDIDLRLGTWNPSGWNALQMRFDDPQLATLGIDNITVGGQVPEPATLTLLALAGLGLLRRRRRKP